MSQKTLAEREQLLSQVEDLMLRGITRPRTIMRMAGIGSNRSASRYVELVRARWFKRNESAADQERYRLLAEAQEVHKRAFEVVARAANAENQGPATLNTIAVALGVALKAIERQSKILGLDSEKRIQGIDSATLNALRDRVLSNPLAPYDPANDPMRELYDALPAADRS